ncbi:DUF1223 domain-containing protein [Spongiimicrobium salis]|uniref:DUF1223 domain-containing protein n=1 Tax=Spongiimicrobium salis TaxID=1667022 RepID=UPI00374DCC43
MFKKIIVFAIVLFSFGFMAFSSLEIGTDSAEVGATEAAASEFDVYEPFVVLELFTSQGCSSCPSADVLLNKVKKQYKEEVYALSYHVDYWNYIGWEDPFSKAAYTNKQRNYNIKFRSRSNYTPQLVVNGQEHFVGSSSSKMYNRINAYKKKKASNKISLKNVKTSAKTVQFDYDILGDISGKNIKAVLVLDERTTQVKRGENRNRTLTNSNIVVAEKYSSISTNNGSASIEIPNIVRPNEAIQLMVFVENNAYDITAASKQRIKH